MTPETPEAHLSESELDDVPGRDWSEHHTCTCTTCM